LDRTEKIFVGLM